LFTPALLSHLVRTRLATVEREVVEVDGPAIKISLYNITDAGRKALQRGALRRRRSLASAPVSRPRPLRLIATASRVSELASFVVAKHHEV